MYINNKGIIDNLVITMVNNSFENLLFYGIALIIVGIILLIICSVLSKKERKENSDVLLNSTIENEIKNNKISSYDIIKENNELEMEKVSLDKIPEEKIVNKVYIKENKEIPKIIIEGNDFEKSDKVSVKPNQDIFKEIENYQSDKENKKLENNEISYELLKEKTNNEEDNEDE